MRARSSKWWGSHGACGKRLSPGRDGERHPEITERWGRLDIVFANAGINGVWAPLEALSPEEWNRTLSTNLTGTFLTVKYAVLT